MKEGDKIMKYNYLELAETLKEKRKCLYLRWALGVYPKTR